MDLNKSRTDKEPEGYVRDSLIVAKEMKVGDTLLVRILAGVEYREYFWWPTFAPEKQTKAIKPSWRSASLKKGLTNPIDEMAVLDLKMKEYLLLEAGQEKGEANSAFSRTRKFLYAAIVRSSQGDKIRKLDVPWQVVEGIGNTRKQSLSNGMLVNGLPYMYDIAIYKSEDPNTHRNKYTVQPYQCKTQGMVEAKYLDETRCPYPNKRQFFTAEENAMIDACPWELESLDPPVENVTLRNMLCEFPIDLSRRRKDNPMLFNYFSTRKELDIIVAKLSASGIGPFVPQEADLAGLLPGPAIFQNVLEGKPIPEPTKRTMIATPDNKALPAPETKTVPAQVSTETAGAPTMEGTVRTAPTVHTAPIANPSKVAEAVAPTFAPPAGPAPATAPVPNMAPTPNSAVSSPANAETMAKFKGNW
jgi:hypothetical protein